MADMLLEVKNLHTYFRTRNGTVKAVNDVSYSLEPGKTIGIVGESGSGKSQEAYSIMGLLQSPGKVVGGSITFEGQDVLKFSKEEMTSFRGSKVAMIFQNPMTCLNPGVQPSAISWWRPFGLTTRRSPGRTPRSGLWR